ncbi:hypothetical protein T265_10251 [Opisthorchis viverrini]|uniref:Uncharacterized protein n=1 Tax=Opisthorchis viverrini TaxID=6198 RepID=A0A074Z352_OPIVI|nr:hypothetical protein T265_10251 [Opisthorchis viverrini]KER21433.1 hypothetical protein T265_10251 [Opisthorchis viverrini]
MAVRLGPFEQRDRDVYRCSTIVFSEPKLVWVRAGKSTSKRLESEFSVVPRILPLSDMFSTRSCVGWDICYLSQLTDTRKESIPAATNRKHCAVFMISWIKGHTQNHRR